MSVYNVGGWIPDRPDQRDVKFKPELKALAIPASYSMRSSMPPVYDQGNLGSCTAQMGAAALQFTEKELVPGKTRPVPSRLFLYYVTRLLQGTQDYDSGASIRGVFKALAKFGYCNEKLWKYDISTFASPPANEVYESAQAHRLGMLMYSSVRQTANDVRAALAQNNPVGFGFSVYDSFFNVKKDGVVPMPGRRESVQGGHAVLIVGYDDVKQHFIVRNSWGTRFGDKGYCYMPYQFVLSPKISSDFWVLKAVPQDLYTKVRTEADTVTA